MSKKIFLVIILLILLVGALVLFVKPIREFEELLITETPGEYVLVYGKHTVGQVIVPKFPNLIKIGFFVFNNGLSPESDLILHIKNAPDAKKDVLKLSAGYSDVYTKKYPFMAPQVRTKKGGVYFFELAPFKYPVGQPLYFYLESPETSETRAFRIGIVNNIFRRGYAGGSTYIDGLPSDKHLMFQNYYKFDKGKAAVLKEIKERLLQDWPFDVFYLGLCIFLILAVAILSIKERLSKK